MLFLTTNVFCKYCKYSHSLLFVSKKKARNADLCESIDVLNLFLGDMRCHYFDYVCNDQSYSRKWFELGCVSAIYFKHYLYECKEEKG